MPTAVSKTTSKRSPKVKSPRCKTCGKSITVPQGWSRGPAVRRHYWAKHRDVMMGSGGSR